MNVGQMISIAMPAIRLVLQRQKQTVLRIAFFSLMAFFH